MNNIEVKIHLDKFQPRHKINRLEFKHGMANTPAYKIWSGLFTRCYNVNAKTYKYYGAKGIKVCSEWRTFEGFYRDMGERPVMLQLDRIDPNGHYEKNNCRWITKYENISRIKTSTLKEMVGKRFGKWLVIERDSNVNKCHAYYVCKCDCGVIETKSGGELRLGRTTQCLSCKKDSHRGWGLRYKAKQLSQVIHE